MKFTYTIDYVNHAQKLIGVVYSPENSKLNAEFISVSFEGKNLNDIHEHIVAMAPVELWEHTEKLLEGNQTQFDNLLGKTFSGCSSNVGDCRQKQLVKSFDIEQFTQEKYHEIEQQLVMILASNVGYYTVDERDSWDQQVLEATRLLSGESLNKQTMPYIATALEMRQQDAETFAKKIIEKSQRFNYIRAEVIEGQRKANAAVSRLKQLFITNKIRVEDVLIRADKIQLIQFLPNFNAVENEVSQ